MSSSVAPLPMHPEDEAGAALDRGDHRAALTVLMRAYGRDLHRHCFHVLRDRDLADDVHQSVFVEAYRDLPRFERRSSLRTWLYGIARHRCLDARKIDARRRRRFLRAEPLPESPDERQRADDALVERGDAGALAAALAELPIETRIAVLLRYREGLTLEEIGAICGERAATVQARVARALPRLRAALALTGVER
jgi:RNA polymerase sigma factor (sigma-70 family)